MTAPVATSALAVGTVVAVAILLVANVALVAVVVGRRGWLAVRDRRARAVRRQLAGALPALLAPEADVPDVEAVVRSVHRRDRPVAAHVVLELVRDLAPDDRDLLRGRLRAAGTADLAARALRRRKPWRRALGCHVLGALLVEDAVPLLAARGGDPVREVRVAAARALGEIGTPQAADVLGRWFARREAVSTTVAYEALCACGAAAAPLFAEAAVAAPAPLRASACFGLSQVVAEPDLPRVRGVLGRVLATDADPDVRAAAADALGDLGGGVAPPVLARAAGAEDDRARRAAVRALAAFDDPASVPILARLLAHRDRETARRAAEALLALRRRPTAGAAAGAALAATRSWAVDQVAVAAA
ncbi:MAG TPA: HEAT repeat domain-containing protein [Gaiellaceae bacterium]|nr:HEAT repeat domain-containing protein [Gaiellaceae bacterium]